MLASIESRFPFLDESLVRFGINLPVKYKRAWTFRFYNYKHPFLVDKPIVRSIAKHYLPRQIAYRQKAGFPSPGLRELRVRAEFFDEGYLAQALYLSPSAARHLTAERPHFYVARLAAIDIFGRLFYLRQTVDEVTHALKNGADFLVESD